MTAMEIARQFVQYKEKEKAQQAYGLAIQQGGLTPEDELEAASYLFFSQGDYKIAYTCFVSLYNRGLFQQELIELMTQAFYEPNVEGQRRRYAMNCKKLTKYPYIFHKEFPEFEELPLRFFPFDDSGYLPFQKKDKTFLTFFNPSYPVIDRYFFKDLEKPIFADDVYSQYQLEYLNDNVRQSEAIGRENHIYLYYSDWMTFCSYLQCLDFTKILEQEKVVILIEEERDQYPIDFKERFGIDYSQYSPKPIHIREVNRIIWHTQLSAHNGGDFFNEIFFEHPNLLIFDSIMEYHIRKVVSEYKKNWRKGKAFDTEIHRQLAQISHPTEKDFVVAFYLEQSGSDKYLDQASRISPALFFQPHFHSMDCQLQYWEQNNACMIESNQLKSAQSLPFFRQFKYFKTFTPVRRPTTSHAATIRYMEKQTHNPEKPALVPDALTDKIINRHYLIDPQDPRYIDSVVVRFEDGKMNPKATFTALAEFLDIPYSHTMTYCTTANGINQAAVKENAAGFELSTVYNTYDEFSNNAERAFLEYFMRDVYEQYGYDFQYYTGEPVDDEWVEEKIRNFTCLDALINSSLEQCIRHSFQKKNFDESGTDQFVKQKIAEESEKRRINRRKVAHILMHGLHFINKNSQPLQMMKRLELDPALLEQPLYH